MARKIRRKGGRSVASQSPYSDDVIKSSRPDTRPALIALFLVILLIGSALYFTSMVDDSVPVVYGVKAELLTNDHAVQPGFSTDFVLVVTNMGSISDNFEMKVKSNDGGFDINIEEGFSTVKLEKNARLPLIINVKTSSASSGLLYAKLEVRSKGDLNVNSEIRLNINANSEFGNQTYRGDLVSVEYAGILARNANLFDSSMGEVWENYPHLKSGVSTRADSGDLQAANIGCDGKGIPTGECNGSRQMIPGFDAKMVGMYEGQSLAVRIPARDAYGEDPSGHDLGGEDLIFAILMVSID